MANQEAPTSPTSADVEEVELTIDGTSWRARVLGRAGGTMPSRVPMLLLGFWSEGARDHDPARESLIVGQTLEGLSEADLEGAFRSGRPPRSRGEEVNAHPIRTRGRRSGTGPRRGG